MTAEGDDARPGDRANLRYGLVTAVLVAMLAAVGAGVWWSTGPDSTVDSVADRRLTAADATLCPATHTQTDRWPTGADESSTLAEPGAQGAVLCAYVPTWGATVDPEPDRRPLSEAYELIGEVDDLVAVLNGSPTGEALASAAPAEVSACLAAQAPSFVIALRYPNGDVVTVEVDQACGMLRRDQVYRHHGGIRTVLSFFRTP